MAQSLFNATVNLLGSIDNLRTALMLQKSQTKKRGYTLTCREVMGKDGKVHVLRTYTIRG